MKPRPDSIAMVVANVLFTRYREAIAGKQWLCAPLAIILIRLSDKSSRLIADFVTRLTSRSHHRGYNYEIGYLEKPGTEWPSMRIKALILTVLLLAPALIAQAERVYRWKDSAGTVNYSEQPSLQYKSTAIEVRGGVSAIEEEQEATSDSTEAANKARNCEYARKSYQTLTQTEREVMTRDEYGNERKMDAEEIAAEAARHKAAMEKYCDSSENPS